MLRGSDWDGADGDALLSLVLPSPAVGRGAGSSLGSAEGRVKEGANDSTGELHHYSFNPGGLSSGQ